MKSICVFCGSSLGARTEYSEAARELGQIMANQGITLIYGGGNLGLMGTAADACMDNGGRVIGVIPRALLDREHGHRGLTNLEVVESMHQRKARMAQLSDGFIALPGGLGTFEELFEVLTWRQLGIHEKPIAIINTLDFFAPMLALLDHAQNEGFIGPDRRAFLHRADTPQEAVHALKSFRASGSEVVSRLEI